MKYGAQTQKADRKKIQLIKDLKESPGDLHALRPKALFPPAAAISAVSSQGQAVPAIRGARPSIQHQWAASKNKLIRPLSFLIWKLFVVLDPVNIQINAVMNFPVWIQQESMTFYFLN